MNIKFIYNIKFTYENNKKKYKGVKHNLKQRE